MKIDSRLVEIVQAKVNTEYKEHGYLISVNAYTVEAILKALFTLPTIRIEVKKNED